MFARFSRCGKLQLIKQISAVVFLLILFGGTVFASSNLFVDKEVLAQWIVFSVGALLSVFFINRNGYQLDALSLLLFVFFGYLLLRSCFSLLIDLQVVYGVGFLFLFWFFKSYQNRDLVNVVIIGVCTIQAVYGLLQYAQVIPIISSFPIIGSFDNPAGFAICLAVGFPFCLGFHQSSKIVRYLKLIAMVLMSTAMVFSESRAGLLCILIATVFYYYKELRNAFGRFRAYMIPGLSTSFLIVLGLLFFLKQDSASGRFLIWRVSADMVKTHPLFGSGSGSFQASYMTYQADFFKTHSNSVFSLLADNVLHPFNEYLSLTIAFGLMALLLCLLIVFVTFKYNFRNKSPYLTAFLSILVFAGFSYPLRYAFVWLALAYCLAEMSTKVPIVYAIKKLGMDIAWAIAVFVCVLVSYVIIKNSLFEYRWKTAVNASSSGKARQMIPEYESLLADWNHNPLFLYNYGAEMNYIKDYDKSNEILNQCELYFNDYDVQILMADNYSHLKQWDNAERHYQEAMYMCPNRFLPLGQMLKLYQEAGEHHKAKHIAEAIVCKPVKIPSSMVTKIKTQAKQYLEQNATQDLTTRVHWLHRTYVSKSSHPNDTHTSTFPYELLVSGNQCVFEGY